MWAISACCDFTICSQSATISGSRNDASSHMRIAQEFRVADGGLGSHGREARSCSLNDGADALSPRVVASGRK